MKRRIIEILVLILVFIAGMGVYHYWQSYHAITTSDKEREVLYWVAPMDPSYRRDEPGKSPMGMDLVPVYADEASQEKDIVQISPAVVNNLGVQTAEVKRRDLSRIINTVGYVTVDENNIEHVHTFTDGWIREQKVKTSGEVIKEGQLLMTLYSPSLNNAQEELLIALKTNNKALIEAGKKKLVTLGMAPSQVKDIIATRTTVDRVKIFARQGGIVSKLNVREGQYVKPETELMRIDDLSRIWIIAEVFERQADWVEKKQNAIATLSYLPGKLWQGVVDYVYPTLNPETHTLRVRLIFPNPDLTLKPNMYANVKIISKTIPDALAIPKLALIRTGEGDRVIRALGEGRFKAEAVKIGIESEQYYQIISGLEAGDTIVTSAQFLIDSESNVQAGISRLEGKASTPPEAEKTEHVSMGVIKAVDHKKHRITVHHQAIPSLGMDEMLMQLPVAETVSLKSAKPGDKIHFIMIRQGDDYIVTEITVPDENKDKK